MNEESGNNAGAENLKQLDYNVGYKKPPVRTQFKPGVSANPKGRPRGAKNLATVVSATINERVVVTENGERKSISKLEAMVKQLVNKAASGDPKAIQQLIPLVNLIEGRVSEVTSITMKEVLTESDQATMDSILNRIKSGIVDENIKKQ